MPRKWKVISKTYEIDANGWTRRVRVDEYGNAFVQNADGTKEISIPRAIVAPLNAVLKDAYK